MRRRQINIAALMLVMLTGPAVMGQPASNQSEPPKKDASPAQQATPTKVELPTMADTKPRDFAGIHNAVAYHEGYVSGSVPEGDAGFDTLAAMGVKTIISVDGAEPDVEKAKARGMRYIHLPIGYNGFDEARKLELVRATRDAMAQGPVYIHCHHGKHRSAGAAAAVAAGLGWLTPEAGVERMRVSGTAPNYKGLYACAANTKVLAAEAIDRAPADFPEISKPSSFVKGMVEVDEVFDHLKAIEAAGWQTPKDHPDLVPAAEAGRLADLLRLMAESEKAKSKPADFAEMLRTDNKNVTALEEMLAAPGEKDQAKLSAMFKVIGQSCKDCHAKHRD